MSQERRRQQRRERQRRRRGPVSASYQRVGAMQLPGIFGWVQRHGRVFILVGIVVMLLSLAGGILLTNVGTDDERTGSRNTIAPTPTAAPTLAATGTPGPESIVRRYAAAPPMQIDTAREYEAVIRTEKGDVRIRLLPQAAPQHVNNFVFLARNRFYNGLVFHRVLPGFVAQGGDPEGSGRGGPGYTLPVERNEVKFETGVLAMASSQAGVSGSQFFITLAPQPALEPNFTAFGQVVEGLEVVRALTPRNPQAANQPPGDRIISIEIIEKGG